MATWLFTSIVLGLLAGSSALNCTYDAYNATTDTTDTEEFDCDDELEFCCGDECCNYDDYLVVCHFGPPIKRRFLPVIIATVVIFVVMVTVCCCCCVVAKKKQRATRQARAAAASSYVTKEKLALGETNTGTDVQPDIAFAAGPPSYSEVVAKPPPYPGV